MTKTVALLLIISLLCACVGVHAEALNLDGVASDSGVILKQEDLPAKNINMTSKGIRTTDKVEALNGRLYVTTSFGVTLAYDLADGFIPLTQNYFRDILLYNALYEDPPAQIQTYIDGEMHLNIFNEQFIDCYVYAYEQKDALSEMIGDANGLDETDAGSIAAYLSAINGVAFEIGAIGDQVWFAANLMDDRDLLVFFTYVGGHLVAVYIENVYTASDAEIAFSMLENLHISAA